MPSTQLIPPVACQTNGPRQIATPVQARVRQTPRNGHNDYETIVQNRRAWGMISGVDGPKYEPFFVTKCIAALSGATTSLGALAVAKHFAHWSEIPSLGLAAGAGLFVTATTGAGCIGIDYCKNGSSRVAAHAILSPKQKYLRTRSWTSYGTGVLAMVTGGAAATLRFIPLIAMALEHNLQQPSATDPNTGMITDAASNAAPSQNDKALSITVFAAGTGLMALSFTAGYMLAKYSIKAAHRMLQSGASDVIEMFPEQSV